MSTQPAGLNLILTADDTKVGDKILVECTVLGRNRLYPKYTRVKFGDDADEAGWLKNTTEIREIIPKPWVPQVGEPLTWFAQTSYSKNQPEFRGVVDDKWVIKFSSGLHQVRDPSEFEPPSINNKRR